MPETLVLDCSVAAKWVLPEDDRDAALALFDRYALGEINLIAPDIFLAEFASLVAKRHRRKEISAVQAREAFALISKCAPRLFDTQLRLARALEVSLHYQLSLWDCCYLELAIEQDCVMLTADRRLFRATKGKVSFVRLLE